MKALRERMPNLSLTIEKTKTPKMIPRTMNDSTKRIKDTTEMVLNAKYKLGEEVMESGHKGMQVRWGTRVADGQDVVIKVRSREHSFKKTSEELQWRATTEVQLNMPPTGTICRLLDVYATKQSYYVVMEKVEGKDLFEHMQDCVSQFDSREVIYQVLEALNTLHSQGRIHKDLKLENVMVDMNAQKEPSSPGGSRSQKEPSSPCSWTSEGSLGSSPGVKLIDFDTVEDWQPSSRARCVLGSNGYIAPEAYGDGEYSPASDIFCVGVIMYNILTREFPFPMDMFDDRPGENYVGSSAMRRIHERLKYAQVDFTRHPFDRCPEAADLCSKMLKFDAQQRPSAEEALRHIWFKLLPEELSPRQSTVGSQSTPAPGLQFPTSTVGLPNRA